MKKLQLFCICAVFCAASTAISAEPLATFEAEDVIGNAWKRTLVTYPLSFPPGKARPDRIRLVDANGTEATHQLSRVKLHADGSLATARISFMAELPKQGSYKFALLPEAPAAHETALSVARRDGELVIANGLVGLALLAEGEQNFATPLRFCSPTEAGEWRINEAGALLKAGVIPGPVQAVLLNPGLKRAGGSRFVAENPDEAPRVTGYTCRLLEHGPLFLEARVRYSFDNGGFYQVTARILDGDPAIQMDEQFDLQRVGKAYQWQVVYGLSGPGDAEWSPDLLIWKTSQGRLKGRDAEREEKLAALHGDRRPLRDNNYGSASLTYESAERKICDLTAWYPWSQSADYVGLVDTSKLTPNADSKTLPFVAVIPIHAGNWRSSQDTFAGSLFTRDAGRVEVRWPLVVLPHPNSMLHTGEYDPDLPFTFGRRQWALLGGPSQYHEGLFDYYAHQGYVTLDDYKDWVLDWPADANVSYPRLVFSKEDVERIKPKLAEHPAADVLGKFLYFQDSPDENRKREMLARLFADPASIPQGERPMQSPAAQVYHNLHFGGDWLEPLMITRAIYRQTMMTQWSHDIDELMAAGNLTPEQKRRLRSHLAALCYLLTEPDVNPRGSMVHLGNPNMPINRFFALAIAASLIPDHPMAAQWLQVSQDYVRFKLAMNTAPGGGWSELISYYVAGYSHQLQAATVMGKNMKFDPEVAQLAVMPSRFTLNLLTPPDPRQDGRRIVPGWGHEGQFRFNHWLVAAALSRDADPELARSFAWALEQQGKPVSEPSFMEHGSGFTPRVAAHADLLQGLPKDYQPRGLESAWWPGFGVNMRAHIGDPDETYLSYHQGYLVSHCDANQGDFVLHSKGAPLVTMGPVQYTLYESAPPLKALYTSFGWHSRVHFGAQTNGGGWPGGGPISQVHATSFGDSADYLRGLGDYGPQRWTRQILFVKGKAAGGPNYFVFRDSFHNLQGEANTLEPKWWFLKTVGKKENITARTAALEYMGPHGVGMEVGFLQPAKITAESRDAQSHQQNYTVTSVGPVAPGEDIVALLYPRKPDEAAPKYESLEEGVAKIATGEGIDFVFIGREPFSYKGEDVAFNGVSGAVRVYPEEVHLIIAEGPGKVSYRGTTLVSSTPCTKVIPLAEIAKTQTITIPDEEPVITFER
jgi:hypothetical protein